MIEPGTLIILTGLGAVVGLDFVSFPQAMLSRPIVAATLAGAICGNTAAGLLAGVLLECFALETMPFGASRYPEWGPASVAAGAVAAVPGADADLLARTLPFAVLAGLAGAMIGGQTLVWLRQFNLSVAARYRDALAAGDASAVLSVQWTGLVIDFGRAGAVTALFLLALIPLGDALLFGVNAVDSAVSLTLVGVLAVGVGGAAVWKGVHSAKGYAWYLAAGVAVGSAAAVFL
ncbi:MAG: PTS sugar transporter subunit IIC [Gemmatimonadaceae bacterium]|jgi:PTS system mannose-specific IIC component